ncbi:MAG: hypothetical protein IJV96_06420 [Clostridia bacterium]|nr:hypothetical protein [Clostridia bacterium]
MELSLKDLWSIFKSSIFYCAICAVILGAVVGVYTSFGVKKVYKSSAEYVLVVEDDATNGGDQTFGVTQQNNYLVVGAKSIYTLSSYLMNEKTMAMVLDYIETQHAADPTNENYILEHEYKASSVPFFFTLPKEETDVVFSVSCNALSAQDSFVLMNAFSAVINDRAARVLNDVFTIEVSVEAKKGALISPNVARNAVIGALVGALVPFVVMLLRTAFDTRITREEDLKEKFAYPVLGQIPHI